MTTQDLLTELIGERLYPVMRDLGFKKRRHEFYAVQDGYRLSLHIHYPRKGTTRYEAHVWDEVELIHLPSDALFSATWPLLGPLNDRFQVLRLGRWYRFSMKLLSPEGSGYPLIVHADHPIDHIATTLTTTFIDTALPTMRALMVDPTFPRGVLLAPPLRRIDDDDRDPDEIDVLRDPSLYVGEESVYRFADHPSLRVRSRVLSIFMADLMSRLLSVPSASGSVGLQRHRAAALATFNDPDRLVRTLRQIALTDTINFREAQHLLKMLGRNISETGYEPDLHVWHCHRSDLQRFDGDVVTGSVFCHARSAEDAADRMGVPTTEVRPVDRDRRELFVNLAMLPFVVWTGDDQEPPLWHAQVELAN
ncbi:MAG: hypothetical protein WCF24_04765 [Acidimicrobiales bacterium]